MNVFLHTIRTKYQTSDEFETDGFVQVFVNNSNKVRKISIFVMRSPLINIILTALLRLKNCYCNEITYPLIKCKVVDIS